MSVNSLSLTARSVTLSGLEIRDFLGLSAAEVREAGDYVGNGYSGRTHAVASVKYVVDCSGITVDGAVAGIREALVRVANAPRNLIDIEVWVYANAAPLGSVFAWSPESLACLAAAGATLVIDAYDSGE